MLGCEGSGSPAGLAVNVLLLWHLYLVSNGETSIESHDNAFLANKAAAEGLVSGDVAPSFRAWNAPLAAAATGVMSWSRA
jgi:hypothetical protein